MYLKDYKWGETMDGLTKLHEGCKECKYENNCNEKRMVACAVMELPPNIGANIKAPIKDNLGMPTARKNASITINMGDTKIDTSLEEIAKRIEEDFYKKMRCDFIKT